MIDADNVFTIFRKKKTKPTKPVGKIPAGVASNFHSSRTTSRYEESQIPSWVDCKLTS